jgi:hypothetical protein
MGLGGTRGPTRRRKPGGVRLKRLYFLVSVAALQILLGSFLMLQAAQPIRLSQDPVLISSGSFFSYGINILGTGRVSGNFSEQGNRSFDVLVFDDRGFASFREGSNAVPALFRWEGARILFDVDLPGSGQYYVVAVDVPSRQELRVRLDLSVFGLRPVEAVVALIVLFGGLALVGASLTLSVWSWRHGSPAPDAAAEPAPDPSPDPPPKTDRAVKRNRDDDTRIY